MKGASMKNTAIVCVLLSLFALHGLPASAESLTGSGCSVSVPGYLKDIAKAYEKETGVSVLVLGGGSIRGLTDLQERRVDFAASCESKSANDPEDLEYRIASWDALVFIVHPSNPLTSITPQQVRDIYSGKINNWKQLGGPDLNLISVITTTRGFGGIGEALEKYILNGKRPALQKNSTMQASSVAIWEQLVEEMREGFASTGFGSARKRAVKMLKVNGVPPTKENIVSGKYPFRRPLYIVIKRDAGPDVRSFVEFVVSSRGQRLISSYGMPSLTDLRK
jgi:phosphate transport system substrate-binding protein